MSELKTCFKKVDYDLSGLLHYIDIGDIALPEIQRPFVWSNAKVRDLFDSMYRGFPVGYFLFWENVTDGVSKQIGIGGKQHSVARLLIVDGQQRLTSLFAVFRGRKVLDENYSERRIEVAFRPRDGKFEVADAAIRRDPEWIPDISELWSSRSSSWRLVTTFLERLSEKAPLSAEDKESIAHNLDRLFDLQKYPFTALEIASSVDEEQVADIFVRINSEGVRLNQADFILTLMSVFWDQGRMDLEAFCRCSRQAPSPGSSASPFNHFIQPDPDQLLRVAVALGFQRGRLKSVYQVLRGKDMETGEYSHERRDQQFAVLQAAQAEVLNLTYWHQFLSCLVGAGFRSAEMISSQAALLYAYAFYLIGRKRFSLPEHQLQRLIGRWFFAASLTGRYTNSPETVMDGDLNRLKAVNGGAEFVATLEAIMANELTNDFWTVTLPSNLDSSSARNPELFAYMAAQNRLGAPVLFSHKKVSDLLDPTIRGTKKALERHHLFPRAWLESSGVDDLKRINQVANFALLEWPDNIDISDTAPAEYVPQLRLRFSAEEWARMHEFHAMPDNWQSMAYDDFLVERRKRMAAMIRRGFESLKLTNGSAEPVDAAVPVVAVPRPEPFASADASFQAAVEIRETPGVDAPTEDSEAEDTDASSGERSSTQQFQREYWATFLRELSRQTGSPLARSAPLAGWMGFPLGKADVRLWTEMYLREGAIGVGVTLRPPYAKEYFRQLAADAPQIESEMGCPFRWDERPGRKHSYIGIYRNCDPRERADWPAQHAWLAEMLGRARQVFVERVKQLHSPGLASGDKPVV